MCDGMKNTKWRAIEMAIQEAKRKRLLETYKAYGNRCPLNVNPECYECEVCRGSLEEMESCFNAKLISEKDRKVKVVFT